MIYSIVLALSSIIGGIIGSLIPNGDPALSALCGACIGCVADVLILMISAGFGGEVIEAIFEILGSICD
jgi:hypothetical protein